MSNKEIIRSYVEVMIAFLNGEEIEFCGKAFMLDNKNEWRKLNQSNPDFNFGIYHYRIAEKSNL